MVPLSCNVSGLCLALSFLLMAGGGVAWGQDAAAILPEWNEEASGIDADALTPPPGLLPDPGPEGEPSQLPPADSLPVLPPLAGPSDGADAPELPDIPGLVAPKHAPGPLNAAGQPALPDPLANLGQQVKWYRSPREGRAAATEQRRPMLLIFGGFDWSPACQALNNDLFANQAFKEYASQHLVVSFLNVPTRSTLASIGTNEDVKTDLKMRRLQAVQAYQSFLKVRSLPTLIMFDADGHEIDRMVGYNFSKALRPNSYVKISDRIASVTKTQEQRQADKTRKRKLLVETQGYRDWKSRVGSTLFAKTGGLTAIPAPTEAQPEAVEPGVLLMDENGTLKPVALRLLSLTDAEMIRRKYAAKPAETSDLRDDPPVASPDAPAASIEIAPAVPDKSH